MVARAGDLALLREVGAGSSYLSQDAPDLVLGLGDRDQVDVLEVRWPGGARETWRGLEAGRVHEIREGHAPQAPEVAAAPAAELDPRHEDSLYSRRRSV